MIDKKEITIKTNFISYILIPLENILFCDIETVPELENFSDLGSRFSRTIRPLKRNTKEKKRLTKHFMKELNLGRIFGK
jgi:hypothetical protein